MTSCVQTIVVELGAMRVVKNQPIALNCVGVGSCIAMFVHDPVSKVAGVAHMALPGSGDPGSRKASPRYVDTAVPLLIQEMVRQGAIRSRMVVKIAGGARMLSIPGEEGRLSVAERNIEATRAALDKQGLCITAAAIGGSTGRTVHLFADSGKVTVRVAGGESGEL